MLDVSGYLKHLPCFYCYDKAIWPYVIITKVIMIHRKQWTDIVILLRQQGQLKIQEGNSNHIEIIEIGSF